MSSSKLKRRLLRNASDYCNINDHITGSERTTAFIFDDIEDNFFQYSYNEILNNTGWYSRTLKIHTYFTDGTLEMQSSNSSDAMLMNIFCNPSIEQLPTLHKNLNIQLSNIHEDIIFGWNPTFENESKARPTECDMKISNHIFEAKLTEGSFTSKDVNVLKSYVDFEDVFNTSMIKIDSKNKVKNYQLYRNILAANKYNLNFTILLDQERVDLIKEVEFVKSVVKQKDLRKRIDYKTWQEIVGYFDNDFRQFMHFKYFKI